MNKLLKVFDLYSYKQHVLNEVTIYSVGMLYIITKQLITSWSCLRIHPHTIKKGEGQALMNLV